VIPGERHAARAVGEDREAAGHGIEDFTSTLVRALLLRALFTPGGHGSSSRSVGYDMARSVGLSLPLFGGPSSDALDPEGNRAREAGREQWVYFPAALFDAPAEDLGVVHEDGYTDLDDQRFRALAWLRRQAPGRTDFSPIAVARSRWRGGNG